MQLESGARAPIAAAAWAELAGYDKIGVAVIRAIHQASGTVMPLNVPNRGALPELDDDDVIEVPCVVSVNGVAPLRGGALPASVRELVIEVKRYERLTIDAALARDPALAQLALAANPLVRSAPLAQRLWAALTPAW
jgi:6-phospho-beta-glucosidase